jgi:hypothetical protein
MTNPYYFTTYLIHSSRLFCWTETRSRVFWVSTDLVHDHRESLLFSLSVLSPDPGDYHPYFAFRNIDQVNSSGRSWKKNIREAHILGRNVGGTWTRSTALETDSMTRLQHYGVHPLSAFDRRFDWCNHRFSWRLRWLELQSVIFVNADSAMRRAWKHHFLFVFIKESLL